MVVLILLLLSLLLMALLRLMLNDCRVVNVLRLGSRMDLAKFSF